MPAPSFDRTALEHVLPETVIGEVNAITPIRMGLSGAGVYAVVTDRGEYVLRLQGDGADDDFWSQHLVILRRAAERGVAPPIVHVDEEARAVISTRVAGVPLPAALGDPAQRERAIMDVVARLRALHQMDASGIAERDGVAFARGVWEAQRRRAGFPPWAANASSAFDHIAAVLARDLRRVVSHNDVNPGNVLWDGAPDRRDRAHHVRRASATRRVGGGEHRPEHGAGLVGGLGADADRGADAGGMRRGDGAASSICRRR